MSNAVSLSVASAEAQPRAVLNKEIFIGMRKIAGMKINHYWKLHEQKCKNDFKV